MIKLILHGCNGKMGQVVAAEADIDEEIEIVAGIDKFAAAKHNPFPVYEDPSHVKEKADVILDFSVPNALPGLLELSRKTSTPLVVATTGLSPQNLEEMRQHSKETAVFHAANMSVGINLMYELIQKVASVFGDKFDIEITEKHHNSKIDAPSGTAYALADAVNEVFLNSRHYVYGRHSKTDKRSVNEIGIHAIRGGTIAGEHTVMFAGDDEILEITHSAHSRRIFALGSLTAVKFMAGKKSGLYTMSDALLDQSPVTNIYTNNDRAMITMNGLPYNPVILADLFGALADQDLNIDMISQTAPVNQHINLSFTLPLENLSYAMELSQAYEDEGARADVFEDITQLTVEGLGMERQSGIAARVFQVLAKQKIPIKLITTSETKISIVIDQQNEKTAVESIMAVFNL